MNPVSDQLINDVRPTILERRAKLKAAAEEFSAGYLNDLLAEVDAALERIDHGTYGVCELCHDSIEADRLQVNPLVRFCLDHLNERERRAHEQDLELATQIQSRLLPPCDVAVEQWNAHYRYVSAGPVGGDTCELMVLADGKSLFFAVGDVSGKGVAASLLMTHLSAIFRSLLSLQLPLDELMSRANRLFCEGTLSGHYATLVCGRTTENGAEICSAGHCPPLVVRHDSVTRFDPAGLPLGLFCSAQYGVCRVPIESGESLVLYTDGVTEAEDADGRAFGEEGLIESLRKHCGCTAVALSHNVSHEVEQFRGDRRNDDLTVLVLRRR